MASGDVLLNSTGDRVLTPAGDQVLAGEGACAECEECSPCPDPPPDHCKGGGCSLCCEETGPLCLRVRLRGWQICEGRRDAVPDAAGVVGIELSGSLDADFCVSTGGIGGITLGTCGWGFISDKAGPLTVKLFRATFPASCVSGALIIQFNAGIRVGVEQFADGTRNAYVFFPNLHWGVSSEYKAVLNNGDFCVGDAASGDAHLLERSEALREAFESCDRFIYIPGTEEHHHTLCYDYWIDPIIIPGTVEVEVCLCNCNMGKCVAVYQRLADCDTRTWGAATVVSTECSKFHEVKGTGWYPTPGNSLLYERVVVFPGAFNCDNCPDAESFDPGEPDDFPDDCGYRIRDRWETVHSCETDPPGWGDPVWQECECVRGATATEWAEINDDPHTMEKWTVREGDCDPEEECEEPENDPPKPTLPIIDCPTCGDWSECCETITVSIEYNPGDGWIDFGSFPCALQLDGTYVWTAGVFVISITCVDGDVVITCTLSPHFFSFTSDGGGEDCPGFLDTFDFVSSAPATYRLTAYTCT